MTRPRQALLFSGGIGDFIHYVGRLTAFVAASNIPKDTLIIFVEATQPHQVRRFFELAIPDFEVRFVPSQLHWTVTNPLLSVEWKPERESRPAYRYVRSQGFECIVDWFLPFLCDDLEMDVCRLAFIPEYASSLNEPPEIFISLRDKGFLWWPTENALNIVRHIAPPEYRISLVGTEKERPSWSRQFTTAEDVVAGLACSYAAQLFIGTDTGFATLREAFQRPNIYCIDNHWFSELMVKYKYWTPRMERQSKSSFAFDESELEQCLHTFFDAGT